METAVDKLGVEMNVFNRANTDADSNNNTMNATDDNNVEYSHVYDESKVDPIQQTENVQTPHSAVQSTSADIDTSDDTIHSTPLENGGNTSNSADYSQNQITDLANVIESSLGEDVLSELNGIEDENARTVVLKGIADELLTMYKNTGNIGQYANEFSDGGENVLSKIKEISEVNRNVNTEQNVSGRTDIRDDNLERTSDAHAGEYGEEISGRTGETESQSGVVNIFAEYKNGIDGGAKYSIVDIAGKDGEYKDCVLLDTDIFDGVKPRYWNSILNKFVYENLAGSDIVVYDKDGKTETISFAKEKERITKKGAKNSRKVIDELARAKGNINLLAIVHIDELLQTAEHTGESEENNHQWLDHNGWEYKKTYLVTKMGKIYETTLNIAKTKDGRKVLYALSNTKKVDDGVVFSASKEEELAHKHQLSSTTLPQKNGIVNNNSMKKSSDDASTGVRNSISEAENDAYMDAYYEGDDENAYKIVEKVARRHGYKYKAFHHTENAFNVFDLNRARTSMDIQGIYFSADAEAESEYGSVRYDVFLKMNNPYIVDSKEKQNAIPFDMSKNDAGITAREWLQNNGYDSVIRKAEYFGAEADEYIVFDSAQIKSAEPFTYADDEYGEGEIIPLSERFNPDKKDIRFNISSTDPKSEVDTGMGVSIDEKNGSGKITIDMSDGVRAEVLNKKSINVVKFDAGKMKLLENVDFKTLQTSYLSYVRPIIKKIARDFGILNTPMFNSDIELEFNYSGDSIQESINKQHSRYGDFVKMLSVFSDVIENAVGVETHKDKYVGTRREDTNLKQMYVLASAFSDEKDIYPVKLEVKEFKKNKNKLYLSVVLTKKESRYLSGNLGQDQLNTAPPTSIISISDLVGVVNPSEGDFLKYFPDSMLDDEQREGKRFALKKDKEKYDALINETARFNISGTPSLETQQLIEKKAEETADEELITASKLNTEEFVSMVRKNADLQKRLTNAKRQMTVSKAKTVNAAEVGKVVNEVISELQGTVDPKVIGPEVKQIYDDYYLDIKKAGRVESKIQIANDKMAERLVHIAEKIIESSEAVLESEDYGALKSYRGSNSIYTQFVKKLCTFKNICDTIYFVDIMWFTDFISVICPYILSYN